MIDNDNEWTIPPEIWEARLSPRARRLLAEGRRQPEPELVLDGVKVVVVTTERLDRCLRPKQVAKYLGVRPATVAKLIKSGELQAAPMGEGKTKGLRVSPESLSAFMAARAAKTRPAKRRRRDAIHPDVRRMLGDE
jgi:excisionase family DNA binding protein